MRAYLIALYPPYLKVPGATFVFDGFSHCLTGTMVKSYPVLEKNVSKENHFLESCSQCDQLAIDANAYQQQYRD